MHKELGPPRSIALRKQQGRGYFETLWLEKGENNNKVLSNTFLFALR